MGFFITIGKSGFNKLQNLISEHLSHNLVYRTSFAPPSNEVEEVDRRNETLKQMIHGPCPKIVIGNWRYIHFPDEGYATPKYFSMTNDPYDRLRTWFYDVKNSINPPMSLYGYYTFEECLKANESDCWMPKCTTMQYLCGESVECRRACLPGSEVDVVLKKTVENIDRNFVAVGIFDKWNQTLLVLQVSYYTYNK